MYYFKFCLTYAYWLIKHDSSKAIVLCVQLPKLRNINVLSSLDTINIPFIASFVCPYPQ